jgi:sarcosine oxidase subunit delta
MPVLRPIMLRHIAPEVATMLLVTCPFCGPRPEVEFRNGGEAHIARPADPSGLDDGAWAEFLYVRTNPKGVHRERWNHAHGCQRWFNAVRDTVSDRILATYKAGERPPAIAGEAGR